MKIFDFECRNEDCQIKGSVFEVLVSDLDEKPECPHCKASMARLLGNPAGRVKGTENPCFKR